MGRVNRHKFTPCLSALGWRDENRLLRVKFSLITQIVSQVCINWTQLIQHRDSKRLKTRPLGCEALGLALKAFSFAIGESRIASPERVTSQSEAIILALPLNVSSALLCKVFPLSEFTIASLLALRSVYL